MSILGMAAAGAAQGLLNTGIGMALEKRNDKRQLRQQEKLTRIQEEANQRQAAFSHELALDMWNKTNYPEQVKKLQEAGLNPGLLYGNGGAGGTTAGAGQAAGVSGGAAPSGGGEVQGLVQQGMGLNLAMMRAQIDNLNSQTLKNKAEANKTAGVDTQLAESQITKLIAETDNERLKQDLTKVQTSILEIEQYEKNATQEDRIDFIAWQTRKALYELEQTERQNYIQKATANSIIDEIKAKAIGAGLVNILTRAQTANVNVNTQVQSETINKIKSEVYLNNTQSNSIIQRTMMGWDQLSNDNKEVRAKMMLTDFQTDPNREAIKQTVDLLNAISNAASSVYKK